MMKGSPRLASLVEGFERCEKKDPVTGLYHPYLDPVGIPTICIGTTIYPDRGKVLMGDNPLTYAQCVECFLYAMEEFEVSLNHLVTVALNQNQVDACLDFLYNCGGGAFASSTLLKRINANPLDPTIRDAFMMWVNATDANGQLVQLPGLVRRRKAEADLYFTPI